MSLPTFRLLIAATAAALAVAACSRPQPAAEIPATAAAPAAQPAPAQAVATEPAANADVHAFSIGSLQAFALRDGDIDVANDGKTFALGRPPADVAKLLSAAGQPGDVLHLSIQPLLVRAGERVLLFDTGAGSASFARGGRLPASLRAAGFEPAQVTDIFLSHAHPDHVGGLLAADGSLAFANARIHLSAPEWAALQAAPGNAALATAMAAKVQAFRPNAEPVPGTVRAVAVDGHTPGHSAYEIGSGAQRVLYIGDTAHHYLVSVQQPDWTIQYDRDAPTAQASRRALFDRVVAQRELVYAVHFPFPGLGRIVRERAEEGAGETYYWRKIEDSK